MCSCLKENPPRTSFDPSGSQSGNQGGVNFKVADKQMIEKNKQIHSYSFLINPTTNIFPLSGQSGNRGVSIMVTLKKQKVEYEINNKIKYTTLQIRSMLV